jgi:hypothetical protein
MMNDNRISKETRCTSGIAPEKQIELALFLAFEQSNHITGHLIHVTERLKAVGGPDRESGALHASLSADGVVV